jgi:hypothetical protein
MAPQRLMSPMKDARPTNSSTLTQGDSLLSLLHFLSHWLYQVGVWRTMGRHRHDGRIPDAHVLSLDLSLVL